jgi:hypothetical protein
VVKYGISTSGGCPLHTSLIQLGNRPHQHPTRVKIIATVYYSIKASDVGAKGGPC